MFWSTSAETYGDFTDNSNRIYLMQLPVRRRAEHVASLRRTTETSGSEYGAFYEKPSTESYPEYKINRSFYLPPINRRFTHDPDRYDTRREEYKPEYDPDDETRDRLRLNFRDIRDIDIEIKTYDNQSVKIIPNSNVGFSYKCDPPYLDHVRLPDIRNVNITVRRADGSVFNLPSKLNFFS
ncbi:hypothetical protein LSH36_1218g00063 [Paralvinella palmiformis]|uniref:Uncharacterized protein n=1 Tax=Paralvinella palmiformis TaxID=53620 RepID=A0AAD9IVL7_9ANNE|nr:hypothetical protein LSH36_1218g00063 [Paralvinella palmiformis]